MVKSTSDSIRPGTLANEYLMWFYEPMVRTIRSDFFDKMEDFEKLSKVLPKCHLGKK
jgi:ABC-type sulfate transport system substrate-binding protein